MDIGYTHEQILCAIVNNLLFHIAPSASPLSVSITVVDSKSLFMTWFPPPVLDHNGIIRSYLIKISTNSNMELSFSTQLTVFNTSVLKPYTSYSVQVAAVTVDTGPFSLPQNVTTQQDGI